MKEAYTTFGLHVVNTGDGYAMLGDYWYVWLEAENMPKKIKAMIVELAGELPEAGEVFRAQKFEGNQYEIKANDLFWIRQNFNGGAELLPQKTFVQIDETLYQVVRRKKDNKLFVFNADMMKLIDAGEVAIDEGLYTDPVEVSGGIYWQNDRCSFMFLPAEVNKAEMIRKLELMGQIDLF